MERPETTDEELVERARAAAEGDLSAFEALVKRHRNKVTTNCRYISGSSSDAEDLAQEVFLKAFFALKGFEGRALFRTWLQRIKVNHCLNHVKRKAGKSFVPVEDLEIVGAEEIRVAPQAESHVRSRNQRERIEQALEALNDTLRIPLIMRDMDQLSYQEIADELDLKLSAVKMRIKRGRQEFQRIYTELEQGNQETSA